MLHNELLGQLENAKNNFALGMAAFALFGDPRSRPILDSSTANFGRFSIDLRQVSGLLKEKSDMEIALKEFMMSQYRSLIKETFELILAYCEVTAQTVLWRSAPNYHFWRLVRNSVSHNFHWHFNPSDLNRLPLTWGSATLDANMQGEPFEITFLGYDGLYQLHAEMADFAKSGLS